MNARGTILLAAALAHTGFALAPRLHRANLLLHHTAEGKVAPVKTLADWQQRRAEILAGMQHVMGPLPGAEKRCPLDVRVDEEVDCGDYVRRFLSYAAASAATIARRFSRQSFSWRPACSLTPI